MVSHQRVKTPTAAAAFLIDHAQAVFDALNDAQQRITRYAQLRFQTQEAQLSTLNTQLSTLVERKLTNEVHRLELFEEKLKALDPTLLLRRGYSITLKDGHAVRDPKTLLPGDQIETRLEKGTIKSSVI